MVWSWVGIGWALIAPGLAAQSAETRDRYRDLAEASPLPEPWEYPNAAAWYAEHKRAQDEFDGVRVQWLRARALSQIATTTRSELKQTQDELGWMLATLESQRRLLEQELAEIDRALARLRGELALSSQDPLVVEAARRETAANIDEMAHRTQQAVRATMMTLTERGLPARGARLALDRWWELHQRADWALVAAGRDDWSVARLEQARMDVEIEVQGMGDSVERIVKAMFDAAEAEVAARLDSFNLSARLSDPDDPFVQAAINEEIRALEQSRADRMRRLNSALDQIDAAQRERAMLDVTLEQTPEERALDDLGEQVTRLRSTYDRLYLGMSLLESPVSQDQWCQVHLHSALVRQMLDEEGGESYLRTAAASYGGHCGAVATRYLSIPSFAASWGQILIELSEAPPAAIGLDTDVGVWTIDGRPVAGAGPQWIGVSPGMHRIELRAGHRVAMLQERFEQGEHLCVQASEAGDLGLSLCDAPEPEPYARPAVPRSSPLPDEQDEAPRAAPRSYVAVAGLWATQGGCSSTQDASCSEQVGGVARGELDALSAIGATVEIGWRFGAAPRSVLHVAFLQDIARTEAPLVLRDELSAPLMLRERVGLSIRWVGLPIAPVFEAGGGVLLSFPEDAQGQTLAPPPLVYASGGVSLEVSPGLDLTLVGGAEQMFWADARLEPTPAFRLGMLRWW